MSLYIKHRPEDFSDIIGNRQTVLSLKEILERPKSEIPHTFLFIGPSGCGKTTLARIVANKLGCHKLDITEINSANNRGIDTARELINNMKFKPLYGEVRVFLIDELHKTTNDWQNAMLKPLEDTPEHVYFLLCTTNPEKLIKTVKNRCTEFEVQLLKINRLQRLLKQICKKEEIDLSDDILEEIAIEAEGSPRQALVILDKVKGLNEKNIIEAIRLAKIEEKQVIDLCRALLKKESWRNISGIIKEIDTEPEKVRRAVLGYMSSVLLNGQNNQAALCIDCFSENYFNTGKAGLVNSCYEVIVG